MSLAGSAQRAPSQLLLPPSLPPRLRATLSPPLAPRRFCLRPPAWSPRGHLDFEGLTRRERTSSVIKGPWRGRLRGGQGPPGGCVPAPAPGRQGRGKQAALYPGSGRCPSGLSPCSSGKHSSRTLHSPSVTPPPCLTPSPAQPGTPPFALAALSDQDTHTHTLQCHPHTQTHTRGWDRRRHAGTRRPPHSDKPGQGASIPGKKSQKPERGDTAVWASPGCTDWGGVRGGNIAPSTK